LSVWKCWRHWVSYPFERCLSHVTRKAFSKRDRNEEVPERILSIQVLCAFTCNCTSRSINCSQLSNVTVLIQLLRYLWYIDKIYCTNYSCLLSFVHVTRIKEVICELIKSFNNIFLANICVRTSILCNYKNTQTYINWMKDVIRVISVWIF